METEYLKIAEQATNYKTVRSLMNCVNTKTLKAAHLRQSNKRAAGVDGMTKDEYGKNLDENLENLVGRMKKFSYRPLPVRRTYIPKPGAIRSARWEYPPMRTSWCRE
jgi:retron-type reverse transcriptase